MQITVTMPDELAATVQSRGITPESFVQKLIEDASLTPAPPRKIDMQEFFRAMALNSEGIRPLPEEALTREGIYQDHD